ncbi:hypothetical protein AB6A40_009420 [Gnathostoma spinigerum]|uniref:Uncharacterized protein n=1 Tax=Gnathostoma spinigerum TaxID=75299 RepID=A0ABD6ETR4_9BILA
MSFSGIKVTSANLSQKEEEPNFCCVICDRKVYQKEPQYIVIRIPACDDCTQEKITVIDSISENRYTQGTQTEDGTFQTNGFVNHQCSGVTAASSEGTNSDVANEDGVPTDPQQAVSSSDS